jgi:hypothetical protein
MVCYEQMFHDDTHKQETAEKVVSAERPSCHNSSSSLASGARKGEPLHGHRSGPLPRP